MSAGYKPQDDDALQDAWAEQRERDKLWKLFEDWCIAANFAYRQDGRIWFHRNGGDGMWEAFEAGASIALRDLPKAQESLEQLITHAYAKGRKDEAEVRSSPARPAPVARPRSA